MNIGIVHCHQLEIRLQLPPLFVVKFWRPLIPIFLGPPRKASRFLQMSLGPQVPCIHVVHYETTRELKVGKLERRPHYENGSSDPPKAFLLSREIPNEDKRRCHFIGSWDCARGGGRGKGRESKPIQFSCFRFSTLFRRLRLLLRSMTVGQAACTFLHVDSLAFLPLSTKVHVRTQDRSGGRHQPQQAMTISNATSTR